MTRIRSLGLALAAAVALGLAGCASVPAGADPSAISALAPTGKLRVAVFGIAMRPIA